MFPQIFGKYVLEREIGAGGMARVYLATLRGAGGFEKRLVVKQIRAEFASDSAFVKRFVEEAKTAVELSHTNIVPVYELGVEQGVYYIAMEFCEGATLSEILDRTGPLEPHEGAYVGVEICRALGYAHRRAGIVHRDVTPRNVLVDEEGSVRLIDFGIAAPVSAEGSAPVEIFGSPGHMPPEQLQGAELSARTDVFAVFALLIEAWSGKPPFRRASPAESLRALNEPLTALTDQLEPLAEHVTRCVALDATARPESADDAARPLREYLKAADLGDVARRLGDRVRHARAGRLSAPPPAPEASTRSLPADDVAGPQTRTFAARDELSVWTRPVEAEPSDETPAAANRAESGPATRRLSQSPSRSPAPPAPSTVRRAALVAVPVGLLVAALAVASSLRPAPSSGAPAPARPAPAPVTSVSVSVAISAEPPPPEPFASTSAPASATPSAQRSAMVSPDRSGTLRLTADPEAVVSIDGQGVHQTRTTPVRSLVLKPGSYQITFRNGTYGPPVAAPVTITTGGTRSVHVDFRQVEPRLTVR
ncbi:MAG TPA: serine/threonine-protein kinase [Polyangiaceae bacterium]|nr:serine/threonine-protein kinase [Polyangiaceae bacterium]